MSCFRTMRRGRGRVWPAAMTTDGYRLSRRREPPALPQFQVTETTMYAVISYDECL